MGGWKIEYSCPGCDWRLMITKDGFFALITLLRYLTSDSEIHIPRGTRSRDPGLFASQFMSAHTHKYPLIYLIRNVVKIN